MDSLYMCRLFEGCADVVSMNEQLSGGKVTIQGQKIECVTS